MKFKYMKRFIPLILFMLLFNRVTAQDRIYWVENQSLSFDDFWAEPTIRKVAALSYCGIQFYSCRYRKTPTYRVRAYFEPSQSWSWKNYRYNYVLKHEQLHFDIAELFTRKIRKYFKENAIPIENAVEEYQKFYNQYIDYQQLYDDETHHGTSDLSQKNWEEKIKTELNDLIDFKEDVCY